MNKTNGHFASRPDLNILIYNVPVFKINYIDCYFCCCCCLIKKYFCKKNIAIKRTLTTTNYIELFRKLNSNRS